MGMTPKDVLALIKEHDIKMVDVRFTDMPGTWQHFSLPASMLSEDDFVHGLGRSEEHTSELQSLLRISYAVFWQ